MKVSQHYDNDDDEEVSWDPERDMEEEPAHMAEAEEVEEEPPMEEVPVEEVHDDDDDLPPLPAPEGAPDAFEQLGIPRPPAVPVQGPRQPSYPPPSHRHVALFIHIFFVSRVSWTYVH